MPEPVFDVVVMVDWSASSTPTTGADSIWVATLDVDRDALALDNHSTRHAAESALRATLVEAADRRVLVGIDVPLGYPAGFAACLPERPGRGSGGVGRRGWRVVWSYLAEHVVDDEHNRNNRYEVAAASNRLVGPGVGPFWGCPAGRAIADLDARKLHRFPVAGPAGAIEEFRLAEQRCADAGRRPLSVWQTAYAGGVGGQALLAIPVLRRLVDDPHLADRSEVWPFTTGLTDPAGSRPDTIVFAEVWPSWFEVDRAVHAVKDAAQVISVCRHLAAADSVGALRAWFAPDVAPDDVERVVDEEGWILGVG